MDESHKQGKKQGGQGEGVKLTCMKKKEINIPVNIDENHRGKIKKEKKKKENQ